MMRSYHSVTDCIPVLHITPLWFIYFITANLNYLFPLTSSTLSPPSWRPQAENRNLSVLARPHPTGAGAAWLTADDTILSDPPWVSGGRPWLFGGTDNLLGPHLSQSCPVGAPALPALYSQDVP